MTKRRCGGGVRDCRVSSIADYNSTSTEHLLHSCKKSKHHSFLHISIPQKCFMPCDIVTWHMLHWTYDSLYVQYTLVLKTFDDLTKPAFLGPHYSLMTFGEHLLNPPVDAVPSKKKYIYAGLSSIAKRRDWCAEFFGWNHDAWFGKSITKSI